MKGIILAGGSGTRLYPITKIINKQLLPIYDKPMVYYPLSTLMLAGIQDILIISTPMDIPKFQSLFNDGTHLGIRISYAEQPHPNGLAEAFIIGERFIDNDNVCLILGDNIFYSHGLTELLRNSVEVTQSKGGARIIGYHVIDPERYGVVQFDSTGQVISIEEKPKIPKSNYAVVGLYFYDNTVIDIAKNLKPSLRGELEITDINLEYLKRNQLYAIKMGRGFTWLDTGTHESLQEASDFIRIIEERQGIKIACLEEIAFNNRWIDKVHLLNLANRMKNQYGEYLKSLVSGE